jgi:hypothetical protein
MHAEGGLRVAKVRNWWELEETLNGLSLHMSHSLLQEANLCELGQKLQPPPL